MNKTKIIAILFLSTVLMSTGTALGVHEDFRPDPYLDQKHAVTYSFTGVTGVSPAHLEGWAIFGDTMVSTGKFTLDPDGNVLNMLGEPMDTFFVIEDMQEADSIVVTVEPEGDVDGVPSGLVLMQGNLVGNSSVLRFPVDFSASGGSFILATPTNGPDTDEVSGIWFLSLPDPSPGLDLPSLPSGWVYEGWVEYQSIPLSSGRFTSVDAEDLFNGYSGAEAGPPFPGEDYVANAPSGWSFPIDLADGTSKGIISDEPELDGVDPTGDDPFAVKPLMALIPEGAGDHVNIPMSPGSMPLGFAVISVTTIERELLQGAVEEFEGEMVTLEDRILTLEGENDDLVDQNAELEGSVTSLESDLDDIGSTVGSWQLISAGALLIGAIIGYMVMRYHGSR